MGALKNVFAFPNPVNEYAARITAGLVVILALLTLVTGWSAGYLLLAFGFILRVLFGPRISPFAILSVKVLAPLVGKPKLVPGPPKRFAQGIGTVVSVAAAIAHFTAVPTLAAILLVVLIVAATLESVFGFCLGCTIFGWLQRAGAIPESVCEQCNSIGVKKGELSGSV